MCLRLSCLSNYCGARTPDWFAARLSASSNCANSGRRMGACACSFIGNQQKAGRENAKEHGSFGRETWSLPGTSPQQKLSTYRGSYGNYRYFAPGCPKLKARIFGADCKYDLILDRDALRSFGIQLDFDKHQIRSRNIAVAMRPVLPPSQVQRSSVA